MPYKELTFAWLDHVQRLPKVWDGILDKTYTKQERFAAIPVWWAVFPVDNAALVLIRAGIWKYMRGWLLRTPRYCPTVVILKAAD